MTGEYDIFQSENKASKADAFSDESNQTKIKNQTKSASVI